MKLIKILKEVTGKQFFPCVILRSPKRIGLDSLTFIEFIIAVEDWLEIKINDCNIIKLYHTKLYVWRKILKIMRGNSDVC